MRNRKHDGNKSSVVNFGVQGWVTILYWKEICQGCFTIQQRIKA